MTDYADKINTSIIQSIRYGNRTFTVSVNKTGITISEPYSNSTIRLALKKGIKNKMTYPWSVFVDELDKGKVRLDEVVEKEIT